MSRALEGAEPADGAASCAPPPPPTTPSTPCCYLKALALQLD